MIVSWLYMIFLVSALVLLGVPSETAASPARVTALCGWEKNFSEQFPLRVFEIVFEGPTESKGATRAAAAGFSVQLSQENEVRND
jgi:hypothetical protein